MIDFLILDAFVSLAIVAGILIGAWLGQPICKEIVEQILRLFRRS